LEEKYIRFGDAVSTRENATARAERELPTLPHGSPSERPFYPASSITPRAGEAGERSPSGSGLSGIYRDTNESNARDGASSATWDGLSAGENTADKTLGMKYVEAAGTNSDGGAPSFPVELSAAGVKNDGKDACGYGMGVLPECAPLASGFVPVQRGASPRYDSREALSRGTLFPGLDLPFMNVANKSNPYAGTPLGDLMAVEFTIHELGLYLDTHRNDSEAFDLMRKLLTLKKEGRERFVRLYGPLTPIELIDQDSYNWLHDPWPWEYREMAVR
jgi:spore coat protein JB